MRAVASARIGGGARRLARRILPERGDRWAVALLVAFPVLLMVIPALAGYPLVTGDDIIQNLPLRALVGELLRQGHLPVYDPYIWSGAPLLGGINAGAAFPGNALFVVFSPIIAWALLESLSFAAAALGVYVFLRCDRRSPLAAGLGAATFGLAGFLSSQAVHIDVVETAAAFVWVLVGLERVAHGRRSRRPTHIALLAVALGCIGLAGSPEVAFYCLAGAFIYAVHLVAHAAGRRLVIGASYAVGTVLGALLAAVQLLPGADFVHASQRNGVGLSFITAGSLSARQLLALLTPHVLGGGPIGLLHYVGSYNLAEIDAYAGILALAAVLSFTARFGEHGAGIPRVFLLIGAVGIVLALGDATPLPHLIVHVPLIRESRLPSRALILYGVASAVLLAHFVDGLGRQPGPPSSPGHARWRIVAARIPLLAPAAVLAVLATVAIGGPAAARALAGGPTGDWSVGRVAPYLACTAAIAAAVAAFLIVAPRIAPERRRQLATVIVALDLLLFLANQSSFAPVYSSVIGRPNALEESLRRVLGPTGRFLIVDPARTGGLELDEVGAPDLNGLFDLSSAQGYGSLTWAPYAQATGTHGQDVANPAAFAGSTFDELDVQVLLAEDSSFEVPAEARAPLRTTAIRLSAKAPTARYFGAEEAVNAVVLAPADAAERRAVIAFGHGIRLLDARGAKEAARPIVVGTEGTVRVVFPRLSAGGIVLPATPLPELRVVVVTPGGAFSPTGALAATVTPPHWRADGSLGPYALWRNSRATGELVPLGRGAISVRVLDRPVTGTTEAVSVVAASPFTLMRSVADIPGWHAGIDRSGRIETVRIRRHGLVQSVALPAGKYRLTFTYTAPGFALGFLLSGLGWAAVAVLLLAGMLARRRRDGTGATRTVIGVETAQRADADLAREIEAIAVGERRKRTPISD